MIMRPFLTMLIMHLASGSWLEETFNDVWQQIEVVKSDLHSMAVNTANLVRVQRPSQFVNLYDKLSMVSEYKFNSNCDYFPCTFLGT